MNERTTGKSPAYEHVLGSLSDQMTASRQVLHKLRRGISLFPRLSIFPACLTVVSAFFDLGEWAVILGITATTALLIGAFANTLVERRLVHSIRGSVSSLHELSEQERSDLLEEWLG